MNCGSQIGLQFQDEGVNLGTAGTVDTLDFVGVGVTATRVGNKVTVTIPGGGGGTGNVTFKGFIDASGNPNYPAGSLGDQYEISVKGKVGGASGIPVEVGDLLEANVNTAAGNQATVGANWIITQFGLQQIFEITGSDLAFSVIRDLTENIGRDYTLGVVRDSANTVGHNYSLTVINDFTETVGGNYLVTATGTFAVSGTNFAVNANSKITAGIANGSMTIGLGAGFDATLPGCTYIGVGSGTSSVAGSHDNLGVGWLTLNANTTGYHNTAVGSEVLSLNTIGIGNTGVGEEALLSNTIGGSNTGIGNNSLSRNTIGNYNTGVGKDSLIANTTGSENVAVGLNSMNSNTTGDENVAVGGNSLYTNQTGIRNVAIGRNALYTTNGGNTNVAVGYNAMQLNTSGGVNVAVGNSALQSNTTANFNTAIGVGALNLNTTGDSSVALGAYAGYYNTTAPNQFFINNQDRTNLAGDQTKSLMYGVFAAAPGNQKLYINAGTINVDDLPVGNAGLSTGDLYADSAANILGNGDLVIGRKA